MAETVRVEQVTAAWLSDLLGGAVESVSAVPIGTGQVGATYRFTLVGEGVPATLVGKFASADPVSRATGVAQGSYARETGFYRALAAGLPVPEMLHNAFDGATHDFALIMRDLPEHRAGDQLTPLTPAEATHAVDALAAIHLRWWGDPLLDTLAWLPGRASAPTSSHDPLYTALWPAFCDRYGDRVTPAMREVGEAYAGRVDRWAAPRDAPRTLVHGDFRQDNMLFGAAPPVVIVDWQTAAIGCGATDLAYFAGTALSPADRGAHESALFDRWLAGIGGERDRMWRIYRRDAFSGFLMGVAASMIVGRTARGDAMFLAMCERAAAMVLDWDSPTLL